MLCIFNMQCDAQNTEHQLLFKANCGCSYGALI
jgi:hypothetical protein